jgi:hypothetical protein
LRCNIGAFTAQNQFFGNLHVLSLQNESPSWRFLRWAKSNVFSPKIPIVIFVFTFSLIYNNVYKG